MPFDTSTLISSGIGALVGGGFTLLGSYFAHRFQLSREVDKDAQFLHGMLRAFYDEIETLWENYMEAAGTQLEALPAGQPFLVFVPLTQEYFTVYNRNAEHLGRIDDHDLRKAIVQGYSRARALIDSFKMNNDLLYKYEQAHWLFQETQHSAHQQSADAHLQSLQAYATQIKESHNRVKRSVQEILRELRKQGVVNTKP